jgi:hypothetical protein
VLCLQVKLLPLCAQSLCLFTFKAITHEMQGSS